LTATLTGFQWFIQNVMGISQDNLPPTTPVVAFAFNVALGVVNPYLALATIPNTTSANYSQTMYDLAVYNLAGDLVINYAADAPDAPIYNTRPDGTQFTFFDYLRFKWGIGNFQAGVVGNTSDVTTSVGLEVIDAARTFTMGNLGNLKTPYGRTYMSIAQSYGTLWGIS
jgi:hypothetical protein